VNTVEAGIPRSSGRTEKRAGAVPDEHHLAVEGHTQSLRPERADCPLFIGRAPKPDQTIDLKARPHLTIGSRNRSGLLRRKTTLLRALAPCITSERLADEGGSR
jgi:hypothetical protein